MKSPKQVETSQDKRASIEGSLFSPSVEGLSNKTTPDSKSKINALSCSDSVSQSQESLEPAYPSDLEESLHLRTLDQADADDEEEIEQIVSKSPAKEWCQLSVRSPDPAGRAAGWDGDGEGPRSQQPRPAVGHVSFPGPVLPRRTLGKSDYQKFVPAASAPELHSTPVNPVRGAPGCRLPARDRQPSVPDRRIVRRASSAGESRSACRSSAPAKSTDRAPGLRRNARAERSERPAREQEANGLGLQSPGQARGHTDMGTHVLGTSAASPKRELNMVEGRLAHKKLKNNWEARGDRDSFLGLDLASCRLASFAFDENLRCSGDDASDRSRSPAKSGPAWTSSSSNSNSASRESVPDKLSEEVDEIWNDLEDYIRRSEESRRDRLPAAFPVSQDDLGSLAYRRIRATARLGPEKPGVVEAVRSEPGCLNTASIRLEGGEPSREASPLSASADGEELEADSPLGSTEMVGQELDIVDRTKRRVYYMARQYSQKIKKANQLLKMKNTGEQSPSDQPKRKCKDLAAILEEKKQGGTAIGARIAEYSQLYDQFLFRETPPRVLTDSEMWARSSSRGLLSTCSSQGHSLDAEDWLLHSTYSNGELADFVGWPDIQELAAKYASPETRVAAARLQTRGASPSGATGRPPEQRWSALVVPPDGPSCSPLLGCRAAEGGVRVVSLSTPLVAASRSSDSIDRSSGTASAGLERPGLTLQDARQVLLASGAPALDARSAARNYLANFNDAGEDDEDYVEIRSEDEDYEDLDESSLASDAAFRAPNSDPCTPLSGSGLAQPDQLSHYLWREPSPGQQNIVQTLRDKFQCLSSSSFA